MATASLVGVREVSLDELRSVPCPAPEGRWVPVPHHVVVEIIVDLCVCARLAQQHARSATERLDVHTVRREVRDDPWRQAPLAAVPAKDWASR